MLNHSVRWLVFSLGSLAFIGCSTMTTSNTARTATEQLLISNAVDQALDKVDFSSLSGAKIQLEEKYMDGVDKAYVLASIRHRLLYNGSEITTDPKDAEIVLEVRSGGIGTDNSETFYGVPEIVLPGMMSVPELKFINRNSQRGTAKIGLVAYDAKTHRILGGGGLSLAMSDQNTWSVLGVGPFKNGTVKREVDVATNNGSPQFGTGALPYSVTFSPPDKPVDEPIRLTRGRRE
jgi:hypothetical protein